MCVVTPAVNIKKKKKYATIRCSVVIVTHACGAVKANFEMVKLYFFFTYTFGYIPVQLRDKIIVFFFFDGGGWCGEGRATVYVRGDWFARPTEFLAGRLTAISTYQCGKPDTQYPTCFDFRNRKNNCFIRDSRPPPPHTLGTRLIRRPCSHP